MCRRFYQFLQACHFNFGITVVCPQIARQNTGRRLEAVLDRCFNLHPHLFLIAVLNRGRIDNLRTIVQSHKRIKHQNTFLLVILYHATLSISIYSYGLQVNL